MAENRTKVANGLDCEYQTMPKWSRESIILLAAGTGKLLNVMQWSDAA